MFESEVAPTVVKCIVAHAEIVITGLINRNDIINELNSALRGANTLVSLPHSKLNEVGWIADRHLITAKQVPNGAAKERSVNEDIDVVVPQREDNAESIHLVVCMKRARGGLE